MKKPIYILIEEDFNQPSFVGFMSGQRAAKRIVGKTKSLKKAEKHKNMSGLNSYQTI